MTYKPQFELQESSCILTNKNDRTEKHGPNEERLAVDLNFTFEANNKALSMFSTTLRGIIYQAETPKPGDLPMDDDNLSELRNPELNPAKKGGNELSWAGGDITGATVRFHYGTTEKSHVVFDEAKVCKFHLICRPGGTVLIKFQVQVHPSENDKEADKQLAFLSKALAIRACTISITPPQASGTGETQAEAF